MLCRNTGPAGAQVEARSNKLAHHLVTLGIALGSAVGLLLEPSADAVIVALAVLKAGACYLPLDVASNELLTLMLEVGHGLSGVQQPSRRRTRCLTASTCKQICAHKSEQYLRM